MKKQLIGVVLLSTGVLLSANTQAENLLEIYQLAKQNDSTYRAAVQEYEAARQASPQAWSSVLPQLNLSGSHSEIDEDRTVSGTTTSESYETDRYSLTLTQTLYRQDQFSRISQADAEVAAAEARFENAALDLILRTSTAYMDVLGARDNLEFAIAEREAIQQQLEQTRQRFEVGLTAITDVHEAQARYDLATASEIDARNQLAVRTENLREITGQPFGELATLAEQTPLVSPDPSDVDTWVRTALDRNLLLLAAEKAMDASRYGLSVARAGHYPTLDLQADYTNTDSTGGQFGSTEREGTTVGVVLNIPLYAGGGTSAISRQAAAEHQRSKELYELQRRTTERVARNSYLTTLSNISRVKAFRQAVVSQETALEATRAGYDVGTRTAVDVLNAQRELFLAQRDYARARYDYILETLRLKQVAGTLTDADLERINAWLR